MKARRAHDLSSLVAAGVALLGAALAGAVGPLVATVGLAALVVGHGRGRGWALSRALERPRLFGFLAALYLPFFLFDLVLLIQAPREVRVARLVRDGHTDGEARARIEAQFAEERLLEAADRVIENTSTLDDLRRAVEELWWTLPPNAKEERR